MSILHKQIIERSDVTGIYEPIALLDKVSNEELMGMLLRQQRIYRDLPEWERWEAILRGEVQSVRMQPSRPFFNKVTKVYLRDTEGARMVNGHSSNEDGIVRYLAVGTGNTEPSSESDTQLLRETFRAEPLTKSNTSTGPKFVLQINFSEGNITTATTVSAGSWSVNAFEVASTAGFAVGDAIQVGTPTLSETRISAIAGSLITVNSLEPLTSIPTASTTVKLMLGEAGAFGNQDALVTLNSGGLFSRSKCRILKNSDLAWYIRYSYIRTAV